MSQRTPAFGASIIVVFIVAAVVGCGSQTQPAAEEPLKLVDRGRGDCGDAVEFTFSSDSLQSDLDQAIGPRVEGCLSRIYFPHELGHPGTSKWTRREKVTKNNVRAVPFGFVYFIREFTYELATDQQESAPEAVE